MLASQNLANDLTGTTDEKLGTKPMNLTHTHPPANSTSLHHSSPQNLPKFSEDMLIENSPYPNYSNFFGNSTSHQKQRSK
jgi:hypothetical protein